LLPEIKKRIIYDNTASVERRGIDMARNRFATHLRKFIVKNGINGYIVFLD